MAVRVVIRRGPKVAHERADDLDGALVLLSRALDDVVVSGEAVHWIGGDFEPERQVVARGELRGRRVNGGIDVRGDGSREAYTGRWRREVVEQQPGEDAVTALRRALQRP